MRAIHTWVATGLLGVATIAPAHAASAIDTSFGTDGFATQGFTAIGSDIAADADLGVVGCSGPQGSLVVAGMASGGLRVVTMWLDDNGALDTRFGAADSGQADGKMSFPLESRSNPNPIGLCQPDGKLLLAYGQTTTDGENNLRLVRILPDTGLPDPDFGNGGTAAIDLDTLRSGLGKIEKPLVLNVGNGGDVLLSGSYTVGAADSSEAGFLLRIDADGNADGSLFSDGSNTILRYVGAGLTTDGELRVAGYRHAPEFPPELVVQRVDANTLVTLDLEVRSLGYLIAHRAGLFDGRHLVVSGAESVNNSPSLVIADVLGDAATYQSERIDLPLLLGRDGYGQAHVSQAAPLSDGSYLFGAALVAGGMFRGTYFARVDRAPDGTLQQNRRFGSDGSVFATAPAPAACAGSLRHNVFWRFTYWKGRPTAIGAIDRSCDNANIDLDYLVLRLNQPVTFGDGFED